MELSSVPAHTLVVYPHPQRRRRALIGFVLCCPLVLGFDALVIWDFGTPFDWAITPPLFAILAALLLTIFIEWMGWLCAVSWRQWRWDHPLLIIDFQGLHIHFLSHVKEVPLPWEEIDWIAFSPIANGYLSISLKDARHWWRTYGNGRPRIFLRDPLTHAQLNIDQRGLSLPVEHIIHEIKQNYAQELITFNVQLHSR